MDDERAGERHDEENAALAKHRFERGHQQRQTGGVDGRHHPDSGGGPKANRAERGRRVGPEHRECRPLALKHGPAEPEIGLTE